MKHSSSWTFAIITLAAAFIAWAGVFFFAESIGDMVNVYASQSGQAALSAGRSALAVRTEALAKDIGPQEVQLEAIMQYDPLALASMITEVGKDAGVPLHVSDATPDTSSSAASAPAVLFTVEADGAFASLVRAAALLESLPAPSSIQETDFEHVDGAKGQAPSWHMNARVRIETTATVSS